jgi:hypothetical protein
VLVPDPQSRVLDSKSLGIHRHHYGMLVLDSTSLDVANCYRVHNLNLD